LPHLSQTVYRARWVCVDQGSSRAKRVCGRCTCQLHMTHRTQHCRPQIHPGRQLDLTSSGGAVHARCRQIAGMGECSPKVCLLNGAQRVKDWEQRWIKTFCQSPSVCLIAHHVTPLWAQLVPAPHHWYELAWNLVHSVTMQREHCGAVPYCVLMATHRAKAGPKHRHMDNVMHCRCTMLQIVCGAVFQHSVHQVHHIGSCQAPAHMPCTTSY